MSTINYESIDVTYPVAGINNNSQGFRDNFSAIHNAFAIAKTEIGLLETTTLRTAATGGSPIVNNLAGSTIRNGLYSELYGISNKQTTNVEDLFSDYDIDLTRGSLHEMTMSKNANLQFKNWPTTTGAYAYVRLHIKGDTVAAYNVTFSSENAGKITYELTCPVTMTIPVNGHHKVVEAWSYDSGVNVFMRYLGEY